MTKTDLVYSLNARKEQAENRLMELLRRENSELQGVEVFLKRPYETEHDAMQLLSRLGRLYEPLRLPWRKEK